MLSPPQSPEHNLHPSHEPSEPCEPSATHEPSETLNPSETPEPFEQPDQTETPEQSENPEPTDFLKTVVDFESLQFLKNKTYKKAVPKPVQPDVNVCFQNFLTEVQAWLDLLKADCTRNVNPAATDLLWETFRRTLDVDSLKLQDLCHSQVLENFSKHLHAFQSEAADIWDKKSSLMIVNAPADQMDILEDESEDASEDSNPLAIVMFNQPSSKVAPEPVPTLVVDLGTLPSTFVRSD